ncbi:MAG: LuxR C-terminal-related transcriptional regulator [Spirochaetia bacterium]
MKFDTDPHRYVIYIYRYNYERLSACLEYICSGLLKDESVLVVTSEKILQYIREGVVQEAGKRADSILHSVSAEDIIEHNMGDNTDGNSFFKLVSRKVHEDKIKRIVFDMNFLLPGLNKSAQIASFQREISDFCKNHPVCLLGAYFHEYVPNHPVLLFPPEENAGTVISDSLIEDIQPNYFKAISSSLNTLSSIIKDLSVESYGSIRELLNSREKEGQEDKLSGLPDILWISNLQGRILFNTAGKPNDVPFKDICGFNDENFRAILRSFHENIPSPALYESEHPEDGYLLETNISPLTVRERAIGIIGITRDISGRKEYIAVNGEDSGTVQNAPDPASLGITSRELEIIKHLLSGLQNKEIGAKLYIAEITVKKHLSNIYQKLNVRNRVELIRLVQGADFWK